MAINITEKKFMCVVCQEEFTDTYHHTEKNLEDPAHFGYANKIREAHYTIPCFCNGTICLEGRGDEGWEIYCAECLFCYDED